MNRHAMSESPPHSRARPTNEKTLKLRQTWFLAAMAAAVAPGQIPVPARALSPAREADPAAAVARWAGPACSD